MYFKVKEQVGKRIKVHTISMDNSTRPTFDPRPCFAWTGKIESKDGGANTDALIAIGYSCSYGNLTLNNLDLDMEVDEQIGVKVLGENGDEAGALVLYEVLE